MLAPLQPSSPISGVMQVFNPFISLPAFSSSPSPALLPPSYVLPDMDPHFSVLLGDNNKGRCNNKHSSSVDSKIVEIVVPIVVALALLVVIAFVFGPRYEERREGREERRGGERGQRRGGDNGSRRWYSSEIKIAGLSGETLSELRHDGNYPETKIEKKR